MSDVCLDCAIWADWANKIISFKQVGDFEQKLFSTPEEKLNYVMEKCSLGFRIQ